MHELASCHHGQPMLAARRGFITGATALAAAAALPGLARSAGPKAEFVDFHHHLEPSGKTAEGRPYSLTDAVEQLERNSVMAMGWPGPIQEVDPAAARKQAREHNEWAAKVRSDYPQRFGLFASLPMNDVDGTLAEIAYVFDVLKFDGIGLGTNYGDTWLGDKKFQPIWQELNRRSALVYVHPAQAPCCTKATLSYEREKDYLTTPWIEFPVNTARTILSLWATGTTQRQPNIRFVFSHGGGVLPILIGRFAGFSGWETVGKENLDALFPQGVYAEFAKLYFECAQAYAPETITMLRSMVPPTQLVFGTDYPYFRVSHPVGLFNQLDLPEPLRTMIKRGNAQTLFPRLQIA